MTLPASGPLTLSDIQTEFGGTNPIGMNEYYAGGGLVPAGTTGTYGAVPSSGALSVQNFYGTSAVIPAYIEEVFSTYLYTGNNSTLSITNGIDVSGKGGLVWIKNRQQAGYYHTLVDTVRGPSKQLYSNTTNAQSTATGLDVTAFTSTGFTLGPDNFCNQNNANNVSWTFRKQPKFFDIVTFTAPSTGSTDFYVNHSLGSVPACGIIKRTDSAELWQVFHQSLPNPARDYLVLNTTAKYSSNIADCWVPTSTNVMLRTGSSVSAGGQYVMYLFASNAGGFGLTGTDNVISCGSFTTDGSGYGSVTLGYEPQWILMKDTQSSTIYDNWYVIDNMRGFLANGNANELYANKSDAENANVQRAAPTATGFIPQGLNASKTYIYIAIRRGPMKVPTSGTSVFSPFVGSDTSTITTGFPVDMLFDNKRSGNSNNTVNASRLVGSNSLITTSTAAEIAGLIGSNCWQNNTGYLPNALGTGIVAYAFQRAPSFFDEVCYTGTGSDATFNHNLGVVPELMIVKRRNSAGAWTVWNTYIAGLDAANIMEINASDGVTPVSSAYSSTSPTSSVFTVGTAARTNASGSTYVAYLFATCAGVSKVGSYTGNGSTQTINCGFTGGARFVIIKRTDTNGNWYVYDTARGMTVLTDPYLLLNSTAAESATLGSVTTVSTGFAVDASILAAVNTNAASYIFLAIA